MELEAENLWIHSASHDFYDKTNFIKKYYFFLVEKKIEQYFVIFKNYFFENRKIFFRTFSRQEKHNIF